MMYLEPRMMKSIINGYISLIDVELILFSLVALPINSSFVALVTAGRTPASDALPINSSPVASDPAGRLPARVCVSCGEGKIPLSDAYTCLCDMGLGRRQYCADQLCSRCGGVLGHTSVPMLEPIDYTFCTTFGVGTNVGDHGL